jgi:hypothetical protein
MIILLLLRRMSPRARHITGWILLGLGAMVAIAARLFLSEGAVSKYTTTIFAKLSLAEDEDTNRRVRAVLAYLGAKQTDEFPPGRLTRDDVPSPAAYDPRWPSAEAWRAAATRTSDGC